MPASPVVHKFGGAALEDAAAIRVVASLLADEAHATPRVVVTSALRDVTNSLIEAVSRASSGDHSGAMSVVDSLYERHRFTAAELAEGDDADVAALYDVIERQTSEIREHLRALADAPGDGQLTDSVLAFGERTAAELVNVALKQRGVVARTLDGADVIVTDSRHGDAAPHIERTTLRARAVLTPLLGDGATVVVPGFTGRSMDGHVTTLGRGGSDLSATVLARAVDAQEVVLWKDVPGIMTADPRIVPNARTVAVLDAREASELAYYGAKVLHPRTLLPLSAGMTLRLRPFANPGAAGTRIVAGRAARGAPVRALSGVGKQAMIALNGTGMLGVPGVAARAFGALAAQGISVSLISQASSEQSICFTVPAERGAHVAAMMREEFALELARGEVENVTVRAALTTIAVVGSGMANTPGIAARIFGAVADAKVNVVAIAQGASERNVSFIVEEHGAAAQCVPCMMHFISARSAVAAEAREARIRTSCCWAQAASRER